MDERHAVTREGSTLGLTERLFAPITDIDHARTVTRDVGTGLVLLAPVQVALALAGGRDALVDAALLALTGALLWLTPARWATAAALVVASGSLLLAVGYHVDRPHASGGRSVVLGLVAVWLAGRALVASLALRRLRSAEREGADAAGDREGAGQPR